MIKVYEPNQKWIMSFFVIGFTIFLCSIILNFLKNPNDPIVIAMSVSLVLFSAICILFAKGSYFILDNQTLSQVSLFSKKNIEVMKILTIRKTNDGYFGTTEFSSKNERLVEKPVTLFLTKPC